MAPDVASIEKEKNGTGAYPYELFSKQGYRDRRNACRQPRFFKDHVEAMINSSYAYQALTCVIRKFVNTFLK